jgi:hypothetical protein
MTLTNTDASHLLAQIEELKEKVTTLLDFRITDSWIPKRQLKEFFGYGDTQMAALLKNPKLRVRTIGKRKFIHKDSITDLLNAGDHE